MNRFKVLLVCLALVALFIVAIGMTGFWTKLIYGLIIIVSVSMHSIMRKRVK